MDGLFYVWNSGGVGVNIHFWHSVTIRHKSAAWAGQSYQRIQDREKWIMLIKKYIVGAWLTTNLSERKSLPKFGHKT